MSIKTVFLKIYDDYPYLIRQKAAALMYVALTFAVLFVLLAIMTIPLNLSSSPLASVIAYCIAIAAFITVLAILKTGRYVFAAHSMIIFMTCLILVYITSQIGNVSNFMGMLHFSYLVVILAALFATRVVLSISTALFMAGWLTYFIKGKDIIDPLLVPYAQKTTTYFLIMITLIYLASLAIITISNNALKNSDEETEKNREQKEILSRVLSSARQVSEELATSSNELSSTANQFQENAQTQASSVEETTASLEEIAAGIDSIAGSADSQNEGMFSLIEKMMQFSSAIASMKNEVSAILEGVQGIVDYAHEGNQNLENMKMSMHKIKGSSDEMTGIINIINDISDKINLLSLNAAIEAARAGEAGRGFAVVADEISKLADQTSQSVKSISSIISANEKEIDDGTFNVERTVSTISSIIEGVTANFKAMETMASEMENQLMANREINEHAQNVRSRAEEIKSSTEEHKIALREVVKTIASINELTQANASGAEQTYSSTEELISMADTLKELVSSGRQSPDDTPGS